MKRVPFTILAPLASSAIGRIHMLLALCRLSRALSSKDVQLIALSAAVLQTVAQKMKLIRSLALILVVTDAFVLPITRSETAIRQHMSSETGSLKDLRLVSNGMCSMFASTSPTTSLINSKLS